MLVLSQIAPVYFVRQAASFLIMLSGGVFVIQANHSQVFAVSDGIDMHQRDMLDIIRLVRKEIKKNPIQNEDNRMVFIESAFILLKLHRNYIFGVATYDGNSITQIHSFMDRVITCIGTLFPQNMNDLNTYNSQRSKLFKYLKLLILDPGHIEGDHLMNNSLNSAHDTNLLNPHAEYCDFPVASGSFMRKEEPMIVEDTSSDALVHSFSSNQLSSSVSSEFSVNSDSQVFDYVDVLLQQTINFDVDPETHHAQACICSTSVFLKLASQCDESPLIFAITPTDIVKNEKVNTNILEEEGPAVYTCHDPISTIRSLTKVLIFESILDNLLCPFNVFGDYEIDNNLINFNINIQSRYPLQDIKLAVPVFGLSNIKIIGNTFSTSATNLYLNMTDLNDTRYGKNIEFTAEIDENYHPPTFVNIQCRINDFVAGKIKFITYPDGNYHVDRIIKRTLVHKSAWPLICKRD